jgi:hypothetical protein
MINVLNTVPTRSVAINSDESYMMCLFQPRYQFTNMGKGFEQQVPF